MIRVERVYDPPQETSGRRVLVDRLWPRGQSRDDVAYDEWCKDIAPSPGLRTWYGHDPDRFEEFADRYRAELADETHAPEVERLSAEADVTLLTASKDVAHSHATVLAEVLEANGS